MQSQDTDSQTAGQAGALLEAALAYAARGWRVFPCFGVVDGKCECPKGAGCGRDSAKHPRIKNWPASASTDAETIREWWARWPHSNVAIATGAESDLLIIDLDIRPGKNGLESLKALGEVPLTPLVRTGSGSYHLYFKHPGGRVSNSSGKLGPGIDVRCDGGYAIAPPSLHISGGVYVFAN